MEDIKQKAEEFIEKFSQVDIPNWNPMTGKIEQEPIGYYPGKISAEIHLKIMILEMSRSNTSVDTIRYWQKVLSEVMS
jgi:hypothetical protein